VNLEPRAALGPFPATATLEEATTAASEAAETCLITRHGR
jgi:hypothetical protein